MTQKILSAEAEMDKAIKCLYLELPSSIADDVKKKWEAVKSQSIKTDILLEALDEILKCGEEWNDVKQIARKALGNYMYPKLNSTIKNKKNL